MRKIKALFLAGLIILLASVAPSAFAQDICAEPVKTGSGLVMGKAEEETSTCVWKGVPYAAPPVGELRWASPQPHPGWSGVRETLEFGPMCMQKGLGALESLSNKAGMSEDCLFLNIWRPAKSGKFPVMIWLHGGGYTIGTGNTPWYWGDRLSEAGDLVIVTVNYRLNIFGFFAHPALRDEDPNRSTGSQGSLDQVTAIRWVHENIANFGGDPENVTVFGESAGGYSVCTMIATPLNRGMIHKAIMQSGGCMSSQDLEEGFKFSRQAAETLGCPPEDLSCLRNLPAEKILKDASVGMSEGNHRPHQEGYLLSDSPINIIRSGDYNRVAFMAGSTRDEFGNMFKLMPRIRRVKPEEYEDRLVEGIMGFSMSPEEAKRLTELYPLSRFNNRPVNAYSRMFGAEAAMACPAYQGILAAARQQPDTYLFRFDYDDYRLGKYMGAAHSMEVPFIFDALDRLPAIPFYNDGNIQGAKELSRIMQGYWINFAWTGDPNGPGLPEWPRFRPDERVTQLLDTEVKSTEAPVERCEFWEAYFEKHGEMFGPPERK